MKNFKWITGVSILLFLVASAMPAYSAKPWPQGGTKGPKVDTETYYKLVNDVFCTGSEDPDAVQNLFDAVEADLLALDYTMNKKDYRNEDFNGYPLPISLANRIDDGTFEFANVDENCTEDCKKVSPTDYKDQAAMAWDTYHGMFDYDKGKDVSGKIDSVITKFLANVDKKTDDKGNDDPSDDEITEITGGRISGVDLLGVYKDLVDLRDCVAPQL